MKLQLKGHDDLYAVEQLQLALFPPESREEDGAVSTLHRGKIWLTAVTRITRNGNHLYFHIFENTLGPLPLMGLKKDQVASLRLLDSGKPIPISTSWVHSDYPEILFADLGSDPVLPDPVDTVLEVTLKG